MSFATREYTIARQPHGGPVLGGNPLSLVYATPGKPAPPQDAFDRYAAAIPELQPFTSATASYTFDALRAVYTNKAPALAGSGGDLLPRLALRSRLQENEQQTERHTCPKCARDFSRREGLSKHLRFSKCAGALTPQRLLPPALALGNADDKKPEQRVLCECGRLFSLRDARRKHQAAVGRCPARYGENATITPRKASEKVEKVAEPEPVAEEPEDAKRRYKCECGSVFSTRQSRAVHRKAPGRCEARAPGGSVGEDTPAPETEVEITSEHVRLESPPVEAVKAVVYPCECGRHFLSKALRRKHQVAPGRCEARSGENPKVVGTTNLLPVVPDDSNAPAVAVCECGDRFGLKVGLRIHQLTSKTCTFLQAGRMPWQVDKLAVMLVSDMVSKKEHNGEDAVDGVAGVVAAATSAPVPVLASASVSASTAPVSALASTAGIAPTATPTPIPAVDPQWKCECGRFFATKATRNKHQRIPGRCPVRASGLAGDVVEVLVTDAPAKGTLLAVVLQENEPSIPVALVEVHDEPDIVEIHSSAPGSPRTHA